MIEETTVIDLSRLADDIYDKSSSSLEATQESPEEPSHLSLDDINLEGNKNDTIINSHSSSSIHNNINITNIHNSSNNNIDITTINNSNGSKSSKDNNVNITKSNGSNSSTNITAVASPPPLPVFTLTPIDNPTQNQDNNSNNNNNNNSFTNTINNNIDDEEFYPQYKLKTPRESKSPEQKQQISVPSSPSSTAAAASSSSSLSFSLPHHHHNQYQNQHTQASNTHSSSSSSSSSQSQLINTYNNNNNNNSQSQQQQQQQPLTQYELQKMFSSQSLHSSVSKSSESVVFTPPDTGTPAAKALEANAAIRMSKFSKTVNQITARRPSLQNITVGVSIFPKKKKKRKGQVEKQNNKKGKVIDKLHELYTLTIGMMLGLRCSVSCFRDCGGVECVLEEGDFYRINKIKFPPKGDMLSNPPIPSHELAHTFKFKSYAPKVFQKIRDHFAIDTDAYMESVCGNCNYLEFISNSKSGQFFFYSHDGKYMIKTQTNEENKFMKKILKDYYYYMQDNPHSLLVRFLGMHRVTMYHLRRKVHFVIMSSVFDTPQPIHAIYDLKGSLIGREASAAERAKGGVLKDLDMVKDKQKLHLGEKREAFLAQIERDAHFLATLNIMDYSLLVGIHDRHKRVVGQRFTSFTSANGHVIIPHSNLPFRQPVEARLSHDGGNSNPSGSPKPLNATTTANFNSISPQRNVSISTTVQDQQHQHHSESCGSATSSSSSAYKDHNNYGNLNDLKQHQTQRISPINTTNNSDTFSVTGSNSGGGGGTNERRLSTGSGSVTLSIPNSLSRSLTAAATAMTSNATTTTGANPVTHGNYVSSHNSSFGNSSSNSGNNTTANAMNDISLVDKPNSLFLKLGSRQLSTDTTNSNGVKVNSGRVGYQLLDETTTTTTTDPQQQQQQQLQQISNSSNGFNSLNTPIVTTATATVTESLSPSPPLTLTRGASMNSQISHNSSQHHRHTRQNNTSNNATTTTTTTTTNHNKSNNSINNNNNNNNHITTKDHHRTASPSSPHRKASSSFHSHVTTTTTPHAHSSSQQSIGSQSHSRTNSNVGGGGGGGSTANTVHNTPRSVLSEVVLPSHYVDDISDSENGGDNDENEGNDNNGAMTTCDDVYDVDDHYDDDDDDDDNNSGSDSEFYESDSDLGDSEYCATPRQSMGSHAYATGSSLLSTARGHLHNFGSSNMNSNISYPTAATTTTGGLPSSSSSVAVTTTNTTTMNPSEFQGKMSSDVGISTGMLNDNRRQPPLSESQSRNNPSGNNGSNGNNSNNAYSPTKSQLRGSIMSSMFPSRTSSNSLGYSNYSSPHDSRSASTTGNNSLTSTTESIRGSVSSSRLTFSHMTSLFSSGSSGRNSNSNSNGGSDDNLNDQQQQQQRNRSGSTSYSRTSSLFSRNRNDSVTGGRRSSNAHSSGVRGTATTLRTSRMHHPSISYKTSSHPRHASDRPWTHRADGGINSRITTTRTVVNAPTNATMTIAEVPSSSSSGSSSSGVTTVATTTPSAAPIIGAGGVVPPHPHPSTTTAATATTTSSHRGEEIYFIGIIDILQVYNMSKRMETMIKSITNDSTQISSVNSRYYAERFVKFIKDNSD